MVPGHTMVGIHLLYHPGYTPPYYHTRVYLYLRTRCWLCLTTEPWAQKRRIPWVVREVRVNVDNPVKVERHLCALLLALPGRNWMKDWIVSG